MSSGVAWIDRKVEQLRGAREFLTGIGMAPQKVGGGDERYRSGTGWKVPHWNGVFTDEQLIALAEDREFRP